MKPDFLPIMTPTEFCDNYIITYNEESENSQILLEHKLTQKTDSKKYLGTLIDSKLMFSVINWFPK